MFRNSKIRTKILMMLVLPIAGMLYFSTVSTVSLMGIVKASHSTQALVRLSAAAGSLAHELQRERGVSAGFIGSKGSNYVSDLPAQRQQTDKQLAAFRETAASIGASGEVVLKAVREAERALGDLASYRLRISSLELKGAESFAYFTETIETLLNLASKGYLSGSIASLVAEGSAIDTFLRYKEKAGQERATVNEILTSGRFTGETYRRFIGIMASQDAYMSLFEVTGLPGLVEWVGTRMDTPAAKTVREYRDSILATDPGEAFGVLPNEWFATITSTIDTMKEVEDHLADHLLSSVASAARDAGRGMAVNLAIVCRHLQAAPAGGPRARKHRVG
jgi:methyl-accepting chemotaxis protein